MDRRDRRVDSGYQHLLSEDGSGSLPVIFPLHFYLLDALPRFLGGRPIYESVAACRKYSTDEVHAYLVSRAMNAFVRGEHEKYNRINELDRQLLSRAVADKAPH